MLSTILALVLAQGVTYRSASDAAPSAFSLSEGTNSAAVLDVRMTTCGTTPVVAKGGPLTVTRAGSQIAIGGGCAVTAGTNQLAITPKGGLFWGAGTNQLTQSLPTSPTTNLTCTAATGDTTDPLGGSNAIKCCETAATGLHFLAPTFTAGTGNVVSWFAKAGTNVWASIRGTADVQTTNTVRLDTCALGTGNVTGGIEPTGVNGWCRIWDNGTTGTVAEVGAASADSTVSYTGNAANCFYIWGAQAETFASAITRAPGPYTPTSGSTVSWNATMISVPNPLSATQEQNFCATVSGATTWQHSPSNGFMTIRTPASNANFLGVYLAAQVLTMDAYQSDGGTFREATFAQAFPDGSAHSITGCVTGGSGLSLYADRVPLAATLSGSGVGIQGAPSNAFIGGLVDTGSSFTLNGWMSRVMLCNSNNPSKCR